MFLTGFTFFLLAFLPGCHWIRSTPTLPEQEIRRGPIRLYCDFPIPDGELLVQSLDELQQDVTDRLGLPPLERDVQIYLFEKQRQFDKYIARTHPDFPSRRAFFVRDGNSLIVYAQWGDRVIEDLRHEVTHALLHGSLENLPLWLDEGLAEYFERPASENGRHPEHLRRLHTRWHDGTWKPDLEQLEGLVSSGQMQLIDYAESWLWVHWLLNADMTMQRRLVSYMSAPTEIRQLHPVSDLLKGNGHSNADLVRYLDQTFASLQEE